MKKSKILLILLAWGLILQTMVFAEAKNTLCVYKLINRENTNFVLPGKGETLTSDQLKAHGITPIAHSKIAIYLVETKDKVAYDRKTVEELGKAYRIGETDGEGKLCFPDLPDGIYYLRDWTREGYVSNSLLVELPHQGEEGWTRHLTVYVKSTRPVPPPPDNPPPDNPPPDTPPDTPPPPEVPPTPPPPGRNFLKTDNSPDKKPLAGARFKVVTKQGAGFEPVLKDGVEYVVTSGNDGKFTVEGIGNGTFYLVETVAPKDENYQYKLLTQPLKFEIDHLSQELAPIRVENAPNEGRTSPPPESPKAPPEKPPKEIRIPKTGDIQIVLYLISGGALFILGLYLYIIEEKKRELWH